MKTYVLSFLHRGPDTFVVHGVFDTLGDAIRKALGTPIQSTIHECLLNDDSIRIFDELFVYDGELPKVKIYLLRT